MGIGSTRCQPTGWWQSSRSMVGCEARLADSGSLEEFPMSLEGKSVLFFAAPLYEDLELWYPKIRLEEEGVRTVVAGLGERTYQGKRGYPVTVDANVDQVAAPDFDGLVIPGGYAPDILRRSPRVLQLVREIH